MKHKIAYSLLGLALIGLLIYNIYAWGENNYWKGVKDTSTFARCRGATPWTADLLKVRKVNVNSCHELEIVLNGEYNEIAIEEEK